MPADHRRLLLLRGRPHRRRRRRRRQVKCCLRVQSNCTANCCYLGHYWKFASSLYMPAGLFSFFLCPSRASAQPADLLPAKVEPICCNCNPNKNNNRPREQFTWPLVGRIMLANGMRMLLGVPCGQRTRFRSLLIEMLLRLLDEIALQAGIDLLLRSRPHLLKLPETREIRQAKNSDLHHHHQVAVSVPVQETNSNWISLLAFCLAKRKTRRQSNCVEKVSLLVALPHPPGVPTQNRPPPPPSSLEQTS